ncbi:YIP1 family protein [Methylophilus sp. 5]|uniref:YIP1 family protein n=1 Tax=Methylophilus sp. 5 TaxID=1112274 RepID=UPI000491F5D8|nr:YIP1 family protein [Methylophilus sp. 5]
MNPIRLFYFVLPNSSHAKVLTASKPSVAQLMLFYVLPLSLIPCVMMYLRLYHNYPKLFFDHLPGNRLMMVSAELLFLQLGVLLVMAWITQNLAEMVNIKPAFRDSLLIMTIATTPLWLTSLFYIVPSLSFNVVVHAVAVLASVLLVYRGVRYIFGVRERGALLTLSMAIVCTAGLGFAVILIGSLISWEAIEQLQFAVKKL